MLRLATAPLVMTARDGIIEALDRSRAEELDELNRRRRSPRQTSLLVSWLRGWLRTTPRPRTEALPPVVPGEASITFAGHATVLVRYARLAMVFDPMLAGRLGLIPRAVQPGLSSAELADVELILVGNAAPDHLHQATLERLPRAATIVVPRRCAGLVSGLGFARVVDVAVGQTVRHGDVEIVATAVRHHAASGRGACAYLLRGDGPSVFLCGASGYFSGFTEVGHRHHPDIAVLPIGGYLPRSFRADHLSPLDALYAFEDLQARMLVPIRYGAFSLSYERLDDPLRWLTELVADRDLGRYLTVIPAGATRKFVRHLASR